jgi:L-rhamnose mutarotase
MIKVKKIGSVIKINEEEIDAYKKLHADSNPGVREFLYKANIHNFSIFIKKFDDGSHHLFRYFEYTGDDYNTDMAKLAEYAEIKTWLALTDSMQEPLDGESSWADMESVYFNE